jgi:hypothetical protein
MYDYYGYGWADNFERYVMSFLGTKSWGYQDIWIKLRTPRCCESNFNAHHPLPLLPETRLPFLVLLHATTVHMSLAIAPLAFLPPDTAAFFKHIATHRARRVVSQMVASHP